MESTPQERFRDIVTGFDTAMLVTVTSDGELRSRPMAVGDFSDNGTMWFLTQSDAPKLDEISHDSQVNVVMQSSKQYVSISGLATPVRDRAKVDELWKEAWRVWFPEGKDDPRLVLVKVQGHRGEYWDSSGIAGIKYLIEAGKAYLSRTRPDVERDPRDHAKVEL